MKVALPTRWGENNVSSNIRIVSNEPAPNAPEERDSGKSMEELLAEQRAAKTRANLRNAALFDDDDDSDEEDNIVILPKDSSNS